MKRVALVDDREDQRALTHAWLDGRYHVRTFRSVEDAVRALPDWRPAVVFLDIMMPGMDGFAGIEAIRRLGDPLDAVPVIAFTAHAGPGDEAYFLRRGFQGILLKPVVDPDEFIRMIERFAR